MGSLAAAAWLSALQIPPTFLLMLGYIWGPPLFQIHHLYQKFPHILHRRCASSKKSQLLPRLSILQSGKGVLWYLWQAL